MSISKFLESLRERIRKHHALIKPRSAAKLRVTRLEERKLLDASFGLDVAGILQLDGFTTDLINGAPTLLMDSSPGVLTFELQKDIWAAGDVGGNAAFSLSPNNRTLTVDTSLAAVSGIAVLAGDGVVGGDALASIDDGPNGIQVSSLTITNGGDVSLDSNSNDFDSISVQANSLNLADADDVAISHLTTTADATITAGGSVTDDIATTIAVGGDAELSGSSITLGDSPGDSSAFGTLKFVSTGDVTISEADDMDLAVGSSGATVTLTATGDIDGATGTNITATTVALTANNDGLTLSSIGSSGEVTTDAVTLHASSGGDQHLGDVDSVNLGLLSSGGTINLQTGTFLSDSGTGITGTIDLGSNAILGGTGNVGDLLLTDGDLSPGNSPGILNTGDFNLGAAANLDIELDGTTVGIEYDQVNVTGSVTLAGSLAVSVDSGFTPAANASFTIINNDALDAVSGTFAGLAEGAVFVAGGQAFQISYVGGDGNDVVLTAAAHTYDFQLAVDSTTYSAAEESGSKTITVNRSGNTSIASSVDVILTAGSATAGDDFTAGPISVSFAAGELSKTFDIGLLSDAIVEADETVGLSFGNFSSGGSAGSTNATAELTITSEDTAKVLLADGVGAESGNLTFVVTLTAEVAEAVTVTVATSDIANQAVAGTDYTAASQTVTFAAGSAAGATQQVVVTVANDAVVEADELFAIDLSNATFDGASSALVTIGSAGATGTIQNDDAATLTLVAIDPASIDETDGGSTTTYDVKVVLSAAVEDGLSVAYSTADSASGNLATAGSDYQVKSGSLNFTGTAGEEQTISVTVVGDFTFETDEVFDIVLGAITTNDTSISASALSTSGSPLTATIANDDTPTLIELDGGNLYISDQVIGGQDDNLTISRAANGDVVITSTSANLGTGSATASSSLSFAVTGNIIINGGDGDDLLTIDFSNGDPLPGNLLFNGNDNGAGGDGLAVVGTGTQTAVYTPDATTFGNGQIVIEGSTISFTGLEPVDISGMLNATLALPGSDDVLSIVQGTDFFAGGGNAALVVSGTSNGVAIETAAFWDNTTLTIDTTGTDGNDAISFIGATNSADHDNLNLVVITGAGTDTISLAGDIVQSGDLTFTTVDVVLMADAELDADNVAVTGNIGDGAGAFTLTLDGANSVDVSGQVDTQHLTTQTAATIGSVNIAGDLTVGGGQLTTDVGAIAVGGNLVSTAAISGASSLSVTGTSSVGGNVTTVGEQSYTAAVSQTAGIVYTAADTNADFEAINFGSTLAGGGNSVTIAGGAGFASTVSGVTALVADHIDSESTISATSVSVSGTSDLGGDVTTSGLQSYNGAVLLTDAATLASSGNGAISLNSTVNGAFALVVNTTGTTTFGGTVGGLAALASLTTNTGGTTAINGGSVTTTGNQTYNDNITLGTATTLSGTTINNVGTITGGGNSLAITGNADIDATISGVTTFSVSGTTNLGADVTSSSTQTYSNAVTLSADVTTTGVGIAFSSTVDGAQSLAVNDSGTTTFGGAVGGMAALSSLTTNAGGTTAIDGGSVTTTGNQTYNDNITLGTATTLSGTTINNVGTITGGGTSLAITGNADIDAAISGVTTFSVSGTTNLGADVTSSGTQTYSNAVTLSADVTTTGVGITFSSTVDGNFRLSADGGSGDVVFGGAVGGTTRLSGLVVDGNNVDFDSTVAVDDEGLDVDSSGTLSFDAAVSTTNGGTVTLSNAGTLVLAPAADFAVDGAFTQDGTGSVTTAADVVTTGDMISFSSAVTQAGFVLLDTTNGGAVATGGSIALHTAAGAGNSLTLNGGSGGTITSGQVSNVDTLTIADSAAATFSGSVAASTIAISDTTGDVTFNDVVTATSLTAAASAFGIIFNAGGTITDAVTFNNTGGVTFGNAVGDVINFTNGVTSTASTTTIQGTLNTTNSNVTLGATTLAAATTINTNAGGGNITAGQVTGGTNALVVNAGTGNVVLSNAANVIGDLTVTAAEATITEADDITQAAAWTVSGAANLNSDANDITLNNLANNFGTLTFNSAGAVVISEDSATDIVGVNTALSLDLDSTAAISDTGATSIVVTNLADVAGTAITLGSGGTFNAGTLTFNSAGAVVISEDSSTALAGSNTALSLNLDSADAITDGSASLVVTNLADFSGTAITVGSVAATTNFGTLTFNSAGAVSISEDGDSELVLTNTAASLTFSSSGNITLTGSSTVDSTASITSTGSINGSGPITATTVDLNAGTGIGQSAAIQTEATTISADSASDNIDIDNASATTATVTSLTTGDGSINFDQTGVGAVTFSGPVSSGGAVDGGAITLTAANDLTIDGSVSSATGSGGTLSIGGATIGGTITVGAGSVSIQGGGVDLTINAALVSDNDITLTAERDVIIAAVVEANGGGEIIVTADTNLLTDAGSGATGGHGGVHINAAGHLNADGNITITGSDVFATSGDVDSVLIAADGANAQVLAGGSISIGDGSNAPAGAAVVVNGFVQTTGALSTVTVTSEGNVEFGSFGDVQAVNGAVTVTADTQGGANGGQVVMADGAQIRTTNGSITVSADGNISLGQLRTTSTATVTSDSGAITDAGDDATYDIIATNTALTALTGIGDDTNALETQTAAGSATHTLAAETNSGDIHISNAGSLTVGNVGTLSGISIADDTGIGGHVENSTLDNITLSAASPLTVAAAITNNDGGGISLTSTNDGGLDDHLTINAALTIIGGDAVEDATGNINLNAGTDLIINAVASTDGGGSFTGTAAQDVLLTSGTITTVNGNIELTATAGEIEMTDGTVVQSTTGDVTATAATSVAVSSITTSGDVDITATAGAISDSGDAAIDVVANVATFNASTGIGSGNALETTVSTLNASNTTSGTIELVETDGLAINVVNNAARAVTISAGGDITDANAADVNVTAGVFTVDAVGGIDLDTTVSSLDATTTAAGDIDITETDAITLTDVDTADGSITVLAGGTVTATDVNSSTVDDDTNDISLTTTSGDILVGLINAGSVNDVALTAAAAIQESGSDADVDLLAGDAELVAATGIGSGNAIETTLNNLAFNNTTSGNVQITNSQSLAVAAVGALAASSNAAGNIELCVTTGNLAVNSAVSAAGNTIRLGAAGDVTQSADGIISANNLGVRATGDILLATATAGNNIDNVFAAESTSAGQILFADNGGFSVGTVAAAAVNVGDCFSETVGVTTADGDIELSSTAGDIIVNDNVTAGTTGDVTLTTTTSGNVTVTGVIASANTVTINSIDEIFGDSTNTAADIVASTVALTAVNGIGDVPSLELAATSISAVTTNGNIDLDNVLTTATTVTNLQTGTGTITFDQSGGGAVNFTTVSTNDGTIDLENVGGNLTVGTSVTADGSGDVNLTTTGSGDVILTGVVSATGNTITINSADEIIGDAADTAADLIATNLDLTAVNGIGIGQPLETSAATLTVANTTGAVQIANDQSLILGTATTTGNFELCLSTGDLTIDGTLTATGGTVRLQTEAGSVGESGTGEILATNLGVNSSGDITLAIASNAVDVFSAESSGGNILFTEVDGFTVDSVGAGDCFVAVTGVQTSFATGTITLNSDGDLQIDEVVQSVNGETKVNVTSGDLTSNASLTTTGGLIDINVVTGNALVNSAIVSGTGSIDIAVTAGSFTSTALGPMSTTSGDITIDAHTTLTNNATISSSTGTIDLTAANVAQNANITTSVDGTIDVSADNGDITMAAGIASTTAAGNITYDATTNATISQLTTGSGDIDVDAIAGTADLNELIQSTSGSIDITGDDVTQDANITTGVDGTIDVSADAGDITMGAGVATTAANGNITYDATVNATISQLTTGSGDIDVDAIAGTADLNELIQSTSGSIDITGDNVTQDANITTGVDGTIDVTADAGDITMANGTLTSSVNGNIVYDATNSIHLSQITTSADVVVTADSDLDNAGAITDNLAGEAANVTADEVAFRAADGIGAADDIDTNVRLLAVVTESGSVRLHEVDGTGFIIGTTSDGLSGITVTDTVAALDSGNDHIVVQSAGGITVDSAIANNDQGNILLSAATGIDTHAQIETQVGNIVLTAVGNITVDESVSTSGVGSVHVVSSGGGIAITDTDASSNGISATGGVGNILLQAATTVSLGDNLDSGSGDIGIKAGTSFSQFANVAVTTIGGDVIVDAASISMNNGSSIDTTGPADGNILLKSNVGNITIESLNAGTGHVAVDSAGDIIVDNEAGHTTNVTASTLQLTAMGTIGAADNLNNSPTVNGNAINTSVDTLAASSTSGIYVHESNGITIGTTEAISISVDAGKLAVDGSNDGRATALSDSDAAASDLTTSSGPIKLVVDAGNITINGGSGIDAGSDGDVLLEARGTDSDVLVNAAITSGSGYITLNANDDISINAAVSTSVDGTIYLLAGNATAGDSPTADGINIDATITSINGDVLLESLQDIRQNAVVSSTNGDIGLISANDVTQTSSGDITTGGDVLVEAGNNWTMASGAVITADGGKVVGNAIAGDIRLGLINSTNVALTAGNNILDANAASLNVDAATVSLRALNGAIGTNADAIDTQVTTLAANAETGIYILEADDLVIDTVDEVMVNIDAPVEVNFNSTTTDVPVTRTTDPLEDLTTEANGPIKVVATGNLTINGGTNTVAVSANGSGNILLDANGGSLVVNDNIQSGTGHITLEAATQLNLGAATSTPVFVHTAGSGSIVATAEAADVVMQPNARLSAESGSIHIDAATNVVVGRINTLANVAINATAGSISDADAAADSMVDITANGLLLNSATTIGDIAANNAIETQVATIAARSNGEIHIDEVDNLIVGEVGVTTQHVDFNGDTTPVLDAAIDGIVSANNDVLLKTGQSLSITEQLNAGAADVRIVSGATISQTASGIITADELGLILDSTTANQHIELGAAANVLGILAAENTSFEGNITVFESADDLLIGEISSQPGFATTTGIDTNAGDINITSEGDLTVNENINAAHNTLTTSIDESITLISRSGNFTLAANTSISSDEDTTAGVFDDITGDELTIIAGATNSSGVVSLLAGSEVRTDGGVAKQVAPRPTAFAAVPTTGAENAFVTLTDAENMRSNLNFTSGGFLGQVELVFGVEGEENLEVVVDWGVVAQTSLTSSGPAGNAINNGAGGFAFDIADADKSIFYIDQGGENYIIPHLYNPADLLATSNDRNGRQNNPNIVGVRFSVAQHESINIWGSNATDPAGTPDTVPPVFTGTAATVIDATGTSVVPASRLALLSSTDSNGLNDFNQEATNQSLPLSDNRVVTSTGRPEGLAEWEFLAGPSPALPPVPQLEPEPFSPPRVDVPDLEATISALPGDLDLGSGAAADSGGGTEVYLQIRRHFESDAEAEIVIQRITNNEFISNRESFEQFVKDNPELQDGDGYEVWLITETGGQTVARPIVEFEITGGRPGPATEEQPDTFEPYELKELKFEQPEQDQQPGEEEVKAQPVETSSVERDSRIESIAAADLSAVEITTIDNESDSAAVAMAVPLIGLTTAARWKRRQQSDGQALGRAARITRRMTRTSNESSIHTEQ